MEVSEAFAFNTAQFQLNFLFDPGNLFRNVLRFYFVCTSQLLKECLTFFFILSG